MPKLAFNLSAVVALTGAMVTPAYSQTGAHASGTPLAAVWETSLGYQLLDVPGQTFPFGLNVDGARNLGPASIAAEAGWSFDKNDDVTYNVLNIGAGPRLTARSFGPIWPFAQILAGFLHVRASGDFAGVDVSDSRTRLMLQPGAGAVLVAGDGWGILGQLDYRRVFLDEDEDGATGENEFRVFFGVRIVLD